MTIENTEREQNEGNSQQQARLQLESIREMVNHLNGAEASQNEDVIEDARQTIQDDALEVSVRSGWVAPARKINGQSPEEFKILLCTGGPAVQIIGDLDEHGQPENPKLQHQDWGTPWTDYPLTAEDVETLTAYCQQFYFGE